MVRDSSELKVTNWGLPQDAVNMVYCIFQTSHRKKPHDAQVLTRLTARRVTGGSDRRLSVLLPP